MSDREFSADYEDLDAVAEFARGVDVVTLEFENISGGYRGGDLEYRTGTASYEGRSTRRRTGCGRRLS